MNLTERKFELPCTVDELVLRLLALSETTPLCLLDSCGVSHLGSRFLIAGVGPSETGEFGGDDPLASLDALQRAVSRESRFTFFTISYELGLKLERLAPTPKNYTFHEPDIFYASFGAILIHDYETGVTSLLGEESSVAELETKLSQPATASAASAEWPQIEVASNFTRADYALRIAEIQEEIRRGTTYQANLTQRLSATLPSSATPSRIFARLRKVHPAPFASFYTRPDSTVVSASPERFLRVADGRISTSPIKGTRARGSDAAKDEQLRRELIDSEKDRAENVMIVDLLRNDLGRVCRIGTIDVEKLCALESHPSLFHLVSTISGELMPHAGLADILRAVFPCGSITGAPKISTMRVIDRLETANRGLSMGAIGFARGCWRDLTSLFENLPDFDIAVAIRTMTIRGDKAVFNVGGGIVIDSDADAEFEESLTKAAALLGAINGKLV